MALRASDLARRVSMVADTLDDFTLPPMSLRVDTDGRVSVCILDRADRARAADRLGLTEHETHFNPHLGRASGSSTGVWCDIPVTVHGLADSDTGSDAEAVAS